MTTQELPDLQLLEEPRTGRARWRSDRLIVGALVVLAFALRVPNLGRAYWVDEGISVGIASHPLSQVPRLLREDGSPPLFYALLHFWMRLFGSSPAATHTLTLIISLVCVPLAYWAGKCLFDRRAGILAAALFATSPFLNWYSTETRMYPLVVALSIVGLTLAWRATRDRSWISGAGAVLAYAGLLYTHDWGIYLLGVTAVVLFGVALSARDRPMALAVALGAAAAVALWIPWLPSFLSQATNTAAPWAVRPEIGDFFADPSSALAGTVGAIVVPVVVIAVYWTRRERPLRDAQVAGLLCAIGLFTVLAGFIGAQIEPSWTVRYLAVAVAPFLLAASGALAPSRAGRITAIGVCVLLAGWSAIGTLLPNPNSRYAKSNAAAVAGAVSAQLRPGDLVVVTQTEQVPVLAYYLPAGVRYVTPTGPVADPQVVDWRNIVHRLQVARPCSAVGSAIDALPVGAHVLLVDPGRQLGASGSAWSTAVNAQVAAVDDMVMRSRSLTAVGLYRQAIKPKPFSPVKAELFAKTSGLATCA
ncbi:MAG TPA: glycosyltransferase family 39 protein [Acidimicrobiales bacterium]|nr:glycosyltransferase family 39 protein [Acidimicrobiales bacterium]